jgi:hypothetical protein
VSALWKAGKIKWIISASILSLVRCTVALHPESDPRNKATLNALRYMDVCTEGRQFALILAIFSACHGRSLTYSWHSKAGDAWPVRLPVLPVGLQTTSRIGQIGGPTAEEEADIYSAAW